MIQTPSPTISAIQPSIISPIPGATVISPLTVTGTVPPGWMFEGTFPIDLVDESRQTITTGIGHDVPSGSWTNPGPVKFEATLEFSTTEKSGFLILRKDNPSGLPENDTSYEIPVKF